MNGYIKLHRKIMEWGWYQNPEMVHLFLHLIMIANFKPREWMGRTIQRGQAVIGRETLSKITGISPQTIRTCLERLKSTSEITIESTNHFSIVTICNYDIYQDEDCEINQPTNQQINKQLTSNQPATNHSLRKEEGKEERETGAICAPPGFPRTENEAVACAEMAGVPKDYAIVLYHEVVGRNYRDMQGNPIGVWRSFAKACWIRKVNQQEQNKAAGGAGVPPNGRPTAYTLKTQLDAIEEHMTRIKNRFMTTDGCWMAGTDEAEKVKFKELVSKRKAIKAQMEALT